MCAHFLVEALGYELNSNVFSSHTKLPNIFFVFVSILGMWSSFFFLGNFLGPTLSGIFVENYGFRATTLFFFVIFIINIFVDCIELSYNVFTSKNNPKVEYETLE